MEKLSRDNITDAIEICRKTTVTLTKLMDKEVLDGDIETGFHWVFDGLWQLTYELYPIEILTDAARDELYTMFQTYLEDDSKSIEEFFEAVELRLETFKK